jgi:hypothetical protein
LTIGILNRTPAEMGTAKWGGFVGLIGKQSLRERLGVAGLATVFALIQSHIISTEFKLTGYTASLNVALGVVTGHPSWREFQSRVLAPYIILGISKITHSYLSAHFAFGLLTITTAGYLAWQLGLRAGTGISSAALSFLAMQFGFCYLLSAPWLYAWDYLGLVLFLVFVLMVAEGKSWPWFAGLFAVAILNRESGEFIALWMVLDPLAKAFFAKKAGEKPIIDWRMVTAGVCCLIGGIAVVEFLRAHLMIEEMGPKLYPDAAGKQTGHVFLEMATNMKGVLAVLRDVRHGFAAPLLFFPCAVIYCVVRLALWDARRWLALSLVSAANLAAIFVVGVVLETRVYLELLPFVLLGLIVAIGRTEQRRGDPTPKTGEKMPA